jgi:hypothetical protein
VTGATLTPVPDSDQHIAPEGRRPSRRGFLIVLVVVVVVVIAGAVAAALRLRLLPRSLDPLAGPSSNGVNDNLDGTSLETVVRQDVSSQTTTGGTLGYSGDYSVINQAQGVLTSLPQVGQIVEQGQSLYQVDGASVVLLYGSTPAYRSLSAGASASDLTGPDVKELNADLVALGYVSSADLSPSSNQFSSWTTDGVERLQAAMGVEQTGTLELGQAVFLPTAARITEVHGTLGEQAPPGQPLLTASSTTRVVTVELDADEQSYLAVGDEVGISLPNGQNTPGTVTSIGSVATAGSQGGSPTVPVLISPTDPSATGSLDQAPVNVTITEQTVKNALVVPIAALLARSDGSYEVETVDARGVHRLVPVSLGLFDDDAGVVQVEDTTLEPGDRVVVPAS